VFTNKKREGIDTFVCGVSLYMTDTPKASIKDQEPPLPIIPLALSRTVSWTTFLEKQDTLFHFSIAL